MPGDTQPNLTDITTAATRIAPYIRRTPLLYSAEADAELGCKVVFKCENLQRTGAFKIRGATNACLKLQENGFSGAVATHSSGNHGAALACAARLLDWPAHVVVPQGASDSKIRNIQRYGAEIHLCAANQQAREAGLASLIEQGMQAIPPYDNADIISGQGTVAIELLEQLDAGNKPAIDILLAPIGGGGLISGCALVAKQTEQPCSVIGVEPAGAADTLASLDQGKRVTSWQPDTIADGLRALVGQQNFCLIENHVDAVLTVTDLEIRQAMAWAWQHFKLTIEPSSATVIAALRSNPSQFHGKRVAAIVSGGNIDPADFSDLISA